LLCFYPEHTFTMETCKVEDGEDAGFLWPYIKKYIDKFKLEKRVFKAEELATRGNWTILDK